MDWRKKVLGLTLSLGFGFPAVTSAQSLDINLNDDTVQGVLALPLPWGGFGRSSWDLGVLYHEAERDDNWLFTLGAQVQGAAGADAPGLEFGAGLKLFVADVNQKDVAAATLGIGVRYAPPAFSRFYGSLSGYYAPDIVTFNDGEDFFAGDFRFGYEILPEAELYLGYRNIEAGIKNGQDATVAEGWLVGMKILF